MEKWYKMVNKLGFGLKNLVIKKSTPSVTVACVGYCSRPSTVHRLVHGSDMARENWSLPGSVREVAEKVGRCRVLFISFGSARECGSDTAL